MSAISQFKRVAAICLAWVFLCTSIFSQTSPEEARLKFFGGLYNYRVWSEEDLGRSGVKYLLILGDDTLYRQLVALPTIQNNDKVKVSNDPALAERTKPHMVFFGSEATSEHLDLLKTLPKTGVITIGEQSNFIDLGGVFQLNLLSLPGPEGLVYNRKALERRKVQYKAIFLTRWKAVNK